MRQQQQQQGKVGASGFVNPGANPLIMQQNYLAAYQMHQQALNAQQQQLLNLQMQQQQGQGMIGGIQSQPLGTPQNYNPLATQNPGIQSQTLSQSVQQSQETKV